MPSFINHNFLIILVFIFSASLFGGEISVYDRSSGSKIGEIESIKAGKYYYVSLESFAQALQLSYSIEKQKKQFLIHLARKAITVTAINPFVKVGEELRQMPINVLYQHGKYYTALGFFLDTVKDALPMDIEHDGDQLWVAFSGENITKVKIEEKLNGFVIRLATTEKFSPRDIFTSLTNHWLYVDIYGGRIDTLNALPVNYPGRKIRQVKSYQLSNEAARIGFFTYINISDVEVLQTGESGEIILSARTQETISDDLLEELQREREKWKIDVIVLDPGHGGKDPGSISPSGLYEKYVTLDIAKQVKKEIERRTDVTVIMTRDRDRSVGLKRRTELANKAGGKLFVSIHVDSNPVRRLRGHTVYFMGSAKTEEARQVAQFENSVIKFEDSQEQYADMSEPSFILAANAQNSYNKESEDFASIVNTELKRGPSKRGYGVRQAGFYVLYGASMPNILLETAFMSNRNDEKRLKSKSFHRDIAKSVCDAIIKFKEKYEE